MGAHFVINFKNPKCALFSNIEFHTTTNIHLEAT